MAEFAYNNTKNAGTSHTPFKLNCGYYPKVSFEEDVDLCSRSCSANKRAKELRKLIEVCCQNLFHAPELKKRAHDKAVKSCSYTLGKKIWLNSKYIKTKRNKKLKSKFFGPFQVLYVIEKQAYKLKLPMKWKIHNIFHISLLEQDITRTKQIDNKALPKPEKNLSLMEEVIRSMRLKQSLIAWWMVNKQIITKCQASITSFCGKAI